MSFLRRARQLLAPDSSRRFIAYQILRESARHPTALFARLNKTNFANQRALGKLTIQCNVCGSRSGVFYDFPNIGQRREHGIGLLRETISCRNCGATMRQRALAHGFLFAVQRLGGQLYSSVQAYRESPLALDILDTDCYSPLHRILLGKPGYVSSKYVGDTPFGTELAPGVFNIDLQAISFPAQRFDMVLTSDVMEHVEDDGRAHAEISRVLRPGGAYVFTVPYNRNLSRNDVLAFAFGGGSLYTAPPHFHGDPLTGGILAYRIYGNEIFATLAGWGLDVSFLEINKPEAGIFGGDCFVATKRQPAASPGSSPASSSPS